MAYNILIVDDSPAMRSFVRRVLDLSGLEPGLCLEAGNGQEALDQLRAEWIDVMLTDINMPVMDGEQWVRRLNADDASISARLVSMETLREVLVSGFEEGLPAVWLQLEKAG
jgi:two-component system chemotaxis response regulator CheY